MSACTYHEIVIAFTSFALGALVMGLWNRSHIAYWRERAAFWRGLQRGNR